MDKVRITYLYDDSSEHTYKIELHKDSFISYLNEKQLVFKRPLRDLEATAIYSFLSQIRLPICRANDEEIHSIRIRPQIKNRLAIESKALNVNFLWDNSDEATFPLAYGYLKNLIDYIDAILPLEVIGVCRPTPE